MKTFIGGTKRSYHPLVIVLFHLNILDKELLQQIPYATRCYWRKTMQQEQFGYEQVREFMDHNLDLLTVYKSKQLFRFMVMICNMYKGYAGMLSQMKKVQQQSREYAAAVVEAISKLNKYVNVRVAARIMNSTYQSYYRYKNKWHCTKSKRGRCFRSTPQQLSLREIQVIDAAMQHPSNFGVPKSTVYYRLLRKRKLYCSLSTFYHYTKTGLSVLKKRVVTREALRAVRCFQYLHVDITLLTTTKPPYVKHYIAFVKDNFSKAILDYGIFSNRSSGNIRSLFECVFEKYSLSGNPEQISIVCDGGSENKGELLLWMAQQVVPHVKKLTAGVDVKSNSMSESVHHILKHEFLRGKVPDDIHGAIARFVTYHNNERYPLEHYGYTCNEVLRGAIPDRHRFASKIAEAGQIRIWENKNFGCKAIRGCESSVIATHKEVNDPE